MDSRFTKVVRQVAKAFDLPEDEVKEAMSTEAHGALIGDFLGSAGPPRLVVGLCLPEGADPSSSEGGELFMSAGDDVRITGKSVLVVRLSEAELTTSNIDSEVMVGVIQGSPIKTLLATLQHVYLPALGQRTSDWAAKLPEESSTEFVSSVGKFVEMLDEAVTSLESGLELAKPCAPHTTHSPRAPSRPRAPHTRLQQQRPSPLTPRASRLHASRLHAFTPHTLTPHVSQGFQVRGREQAARLQSSGRPARARGQLRGRRRVVVLQARSHALARLPAMACLGSSPAGTQTAAMQPPHRLPHRLPAPLPRTQPPCSRHAAAMLPPQLARVGARTPQPAPQRPSQPRAPYSRPRALAGWRGLQSAPEAEPRP